MNEVTTADQAPAPSLADHAAINRAAAAFLEGTAETAAPAPDAAATPNAAPQPEGISFETFREERERGAFFKGEAERLRSEADTLRGRASTLKEQLKAQQPELDDYRQVAQLLRENPDIYAELQARRPATSATKAADLDPEAREQLDTVFRYVTAQRQRAAQAADRADKQERYNQLCAQVDSLLEEAGYPAELRDAAREQAIDSIIMGARLDKRLDNVDAIPILFNRWHRFNLGLHGAAARAVHAAPAGRTPALSDRDGIMERALAFARLRGWAG